MANPMNVPINVPFKLARVKNQDLVDIFYGANSLIPAPNVPSGSFGSDLDSSGDEDKSMG